MLNDWRWPLGRKRTALTSPLLSSSLKALVKLVASDECVEDSDGALDDEDGCFMEERGCCGCCLTLLTEADALLEFSSLPCLSKYTSRCSAVC